MLQNQDDVLIETERIRSVFQQAPLTLVVTVINTALTAYVLMPVVRAGVLAIWVGLIVVVSCARWVLRQLIRGQAPDSARCRLWAGVSISGSLTTGVLWGLGAAALAPVGDSYRLFFAFVVGGMCAGTTAVNSAHFATVLAFILPATLPLAMRFVAEGSPTRSVSGLMVLVFAAAMSLTSLRAHRAFGDRIRLQLALSRQSSELSNANQRLLNEIAERQKAEAILHQAQKMEAIGHLTGGIAHDFNNLLHVVTASLSMIDRLATGNARILGYVQAAEHAAKQGARLTNSLLAFARRQSLKVQRVDLTACCRNSVQYCSGRRETPSCSGFFPRQSCLVAISTRCISNRRCSIL